MISNLFDGANSSTDQSRSSCGLTSSETTNDGKCEDWRNRVRDLELELAYFITYITKNWQTNR
jgi:hypothetical protein